MESAKKTNYFNFGGDYLPVLGNIYKNQPQDFGNTPNRQTR